MPRAFKAQARVRRHPPARTHAPPPRILAGEFEPCIGRHHSEAGRRGETVADLRIHPPARLAGRRRSSDDAVVPQRLYTTGRPAPRGLHGDCEAPASRARVELNQPAHAPFLVVPAMAEQGPGPTLHDQSRLGVGVAQTAPDLEGGAGFAVPAVTPHADLERRGEGRPGGKLADTESFEHQPLPAGSQRRALQSRGAIDIGPRKSRLGLDPQARGAALTPLAALHQLPAQASRHHPLREIARLQTRRFIVDLDLAPAMAGGGPQVHSAGRAPAQVGVDARQGRVELARQREGVRVVHRPSRLRHGHPRQQALTQTGIESEVGARHIAVVVQGLRVAAGEAAVVPAAPQRQVADPRTPPAARRVEREGEGRAREQPAQLEPVALQRPPVCQQGVGEGGRAGDAELPARRTAGGRPLDAGRDGIDRAGGHGPHDLGQHGLDDRVPARGVHLGCAQIEARIDDEADWSRASARHRKVAREQAGIAHLGDLGAVGIVIGIVEMVLPEASFRAAVRRGDELIPEELSGHDVAGDPASPKLEPIRKRSVKQDDPAFRVRHGDVHGTMSPGPVRIPQGNSGLRGSGQIAGLLDSHEVLPRLRDKGLQGCAIHHISGRDDGVAVVDFFFDQVSTVNFEPGKQHDRAVEIGREVRGGIAGRARDAGYAERAAVAGDGTDEGGLGRSGVAQVGRADSQCLQDSSVNQGVEQSTGQ